MRASTDPTIKALLPYLGGKRRLAPLIVDILCAGVDRADLYCEPFHGSLAVGLEVRRRLARTPMIVNDANALVANLATVVATEEWADEAAQTLKATPFHESIFQSACQWLETARSDEEARGWGCSLAERMQRSDDLRVHAAVQYLIASWMGPNGEAGAAERWEALRERFCVRWSSSGGDPARRFTSMIESIPAWLALLRSETTFLCRDAIQVIESLPEPTGDDWIMHGCCGETKPPTLLYVDPPYLQATRSTDYQVDVDDGTGTFYEEDDFHARLREALRRFEERPSSQPVRIVVSYYDHERLDRLYEIAEGPWEKHVAPVNKASGQARRGAIGASADETLLTLNCPAAGELVAAFNAKGAHKCG